MSYSSSHHQYREIHIDDQLKLVEPQLKYAQASLSWVQATDVIQFMGADFSNPSLEGEQERIEDIIKNEDEYSWMIECEGRVIGNVCINCIAEKTKEFGRRAGNLTVLIGDRAYWGKGIGTKVCAVVLDWAFSDGGFETMAARALQENTASIKTMQKLGFAEIGMEPFDGEIHGKKTVWIRMKMERDTWFSKS